MSEGALKGSTMESATNPGTPILTTSTRGIPRTNTSPVTPARVTGPILLPMIEDQVIAETSPMNFEEFLVMMRRTARSTDLIRDVTPPCRPVSLLLPQVLRIQIFEPIQIFCFEKRFGE